MMMILGLLALGLALTLLLTMQQRGVSQGMYRSYFVQGVLALLGISLVPNHWLQAVLLLMLVNLFRDPMMGVHLSRATPLFLMTLAGVLVSQQLDLSSVYPILAMIVAGGCILAVQSMAFALNELGKRSHIKLYAGQENVNNTQSISVVCTCAAWGLAWSQSLWWVLAIPVVAFPVLWTVWNDWTEERSVTMGPLVLVGVELASLPLVIGWWAAIIIPFGVAFFAWAIIQAFRFEKWWDSGRVRCWYTMLLTGWWHAGWKVMTFGRGWQSWVGYNGFIIDVAMKTNRRHIVNTKFMMSTAHNEFVQMLFEHGAVGLVLLCGYVGTSLWRLGNGSDEAQAVYLLALGMIGVACTLHPWTWTHGTITEVNEAGTPTKGGGATQMYTIGSPALNWLAFLTAILVEVAR